MTTNQNADSSQFGPLADQNIARLSAQVAQYVTRPKSISKADAEQDAAIALIEMRERWQAERSSHLEPVRQERMIIAWARQRLIDKYQTEFNHQKRTHSIEGGISSRNDRSGRLEVQYADPKTAYPGDYRGRGADGAMSPTQQVADHRAPKLTELDRDEIRALVARLPQRQREIVEMHLFEGMTQAEVAKTLGISQPAVSAGFERAREALREMLAPFAESVS